MLSLFLRETMFGLRGATTASGECGVVFTLTGTWSPQDPLGRCHSGRKKRKSSHSFLHSRCPRQALVLPWVALHGVVSPLLWELVAQSFSVEPLLSGAPIVILFSHFSINCSDLVHLLHHYMLLKLEDAQPQFCGGRMQNRVFLHLSGTSSLLQGLEEYSTLFCINYLLTDKVYRFFFSLDIPTVQPWQPVVLVCQP